MGAERTVFVSSHVTARRGIARRGKASRVKGAERINGSLAAGHVRAWPVEATLVMGTECN